MPIYEYKCLQCQKVTEITHPVSQKPSQMACEKCGSSKLARVFGNIFFMKKSADLDFSQNYPSNSSSCSPSCGGVCSTCSR